MFEHSEVVPLQRRKRSGADYYLQGFRDGYNGQPQRPIRGKQNQRQYSKGYEQGQQAKDDQGDTRSLH